jgi:uncharacterized protein YbaA (DUF1428 family)
VPTATREACRVLARTAAMAFRNHGAPSVVGCWGNAVPEGKVAPFTMVVQRKAEGRVVFSWISWPSRSARA